MLCESDLPKPITSSSDHHVTVVHAVSTSIVEFSRSISEYDGVHHRVAFLTTLTITGLFHSELADKNCTKELTLFVFDW